MRFDGDPERAGRPLRLLSSALLLTGIGAAALHGARGLDPATTPTRPAPMVVQVLEVTPAPEQAPEAVSPEPAPEPAPAPTPRPTPKRLARRSKVTPPPAPAPEAASPEPAPSPAPVRLGLSLSSMASAHGGPAFAVGSPGGKPGGQRTGGAKAPPPKPAAPAAKAPRTTPRLLHAAEPAYPVTARAEGIEGVVVLALTIGPDGSVEKARVLRGLGHGLDEAALAAGRDTRWTPATEGGHPIRTRRRFHVRFQLDS